MVKIMKVRDGVGGDKSRKGVKEKEYLMKNEKESQGNNFK